MRSSLQPVLCALQWWVWGGGINGAKEVYPPPVLYVPCGGWGGGHGAKEELYPPPHTHPHLYCMYPSGGSGWGFMGLS